MSPIPTLNTLPIHGCYDFFKFSTISIYFLTNCQEFEQKDIENKKISSSAFEDEVKWLFKYQNNDQSEVHGPFDSEAMNGWAENGYFKKAVYVKKAHAEDNIFYSSDRIDFSLYV